MPINDDGYITDPLATIAATLQARDQTRPTRKSTTMLAGRAVRSIRSESVRAPWRSA